jgi:hypothetical protein
MHGSGHHLATGLCQNRAVEQLGDTSRVPTSPWRRRLVLGFIVAVLGVQVGFIINGYRDPHKFFAFQPFNESSTWRADIVRVTWDGRRLPIEGGWAGYEWNELVDMSALRGPSNLRHAYMGVGATVDFLADTETRYFEATVTYFENTRGPNVTVLRSSERAAP